MKDLHRMEGVDHKKEVIATVLPEIQTHKGLTQEGEQAGQTQEVHSLKENSGETKEDVGHVHLDTQKKFVHTTVNMRSHPNLAGSVTATIKNIVVTNRFWMTNIIENK